MYDSLAMMALSAPCCDPLFHIAYDLQSYHHGCLSAKKHCSDLEAIFDLRIVRYSESSDPGTLKVQWRYHRDLFQVHIEH